MSGTKSIKKRNDGAKLEELVELIESSFHPRDFKVELRKHVKDDDDGEIIAELDILITGMVGRCPYKLLIECRDRPSSGPQGQDWIDQLHGRKERLNCDNVIAVSSTGFTSPAKKAASRHGIHLRTLSEITPEETRAWILPRFGPFLICEQRLTGVKVTLGPIPDPDYPEKWIWAPEDANLVLVQTGSSEPVDVRQLWKSVWESTLADQPHPISISDYSAVCDGRRFPVDQINFNVSNSTTTYQAIDSLVAEYSDGKSDRDAIAQWTYDVDGSTVKVSVVGLQPRAGDSTKPKAPSLNVTIQLPPQTDEAHPEASPQIRPVPE